jgi:hypothetical protein
MNRLLSVLVVTAAAILGAQPSAEAAPVQYCPVCIGSGGAWYCYANFGGDCTPPSGVVHCTSAQVSACTKWVVPMSSPGSDV